MRKGSIVAVALVFFGAAHGEWNTDSPQPWKDALKVWPTYHNLGSDYVAFSPFESSFIHYYAASEEVAAAVDTLALALARHCQIPFARVRATTPYHGQSSLSIVWRPNRSPFDEERPRFEDPNAWRIQIGLRGAIVQAKSDEGLLYAARVLLRLVEAAPGPCLRRMILEDWRELVPEEELHSLDAVADIALPRQPSATKEEGPEGALGNTAEGGGPRSTKH